MADASTKQLTVDKLRVNEILIGPEDGQHMTLDPSALWLWKGKGRPCAALFLDRGRPHFSFYDANGKERVCLFLEGDGSPHFYLQDGNGNPRISCFLLDDGVPYLALSDGARADRLKLHTDTDDFDPIVALKDKTGKDVLEITLDYQGKPSLVIPDGQGHRVSWLTAETKKEG